MNPPSLTKNEQRTLSQNNGIHLWCEQVANALNAAGYDVKAIIKLFKPEIDVPFTKENVKELLWRTAQKAMYKKHSTTELSKDKEITEIHKVVMRFLAEKAYLEYIPFPSLEEVMLKEELKK